MRGATAFTATLAILALIWSQTTPSSMAIQLANGTVYFDKAPDLVSVTSPYKSIDTPGTTYFFTISLPANAGEPLQRVTISQIDGIEDIQFLLKETYAFEGKGWDGDRKVTLGEVTRDKEKPTIAVTFNPPVPPGKTVTIALHAIRNPFSSGVYLFGVTAFPAGEKAYGLYLGVGRLQFYGGGRRI